MSYRNQSIINSRGGSITISNTENREYVSINSYSGSNITLNNTGLSIFSPNNSQKKINNDDFEDVGNDKTTYVGGNKYERVNVNYSLVVGDNLALYTDAYNIWNDKFTDVAVANVQPDVIKPAKIITPGIPIDETITVNGDTPSLNIVNPALTQLKDDIISGVVPNSATLPTSPDSNTNFGDILKKIVSVAKSKLNDLSEFSTSIVENLSSKNVNTVFFDNIKDKLQYKSPSTAGGNYPTNTQKENNLQGLITKTQEELLPIEANLGEGGNYSINVARNMRYVVGAATNNNPTGNIDEVGRQVPGPVIVTNAGVINTIDGAYEITEVDNSTMFPCGTLTLELGNKFVTKVGSGGITFATGGSIFIGSETAVKINGLQTIVGGKDVIIGGEKNISINSPNVNISSENQIVVDSNLGITNNLITKGGLLCNGEMYVNHITAPREIQQTLIGFTKEGGLGFLRPGQTILGLITIPTAGIISAPFTILLGVQTGLAVELTPHGHEFPNLPLSLVGSSDTTSANAIIRQECEKLNEIEPVKSKPISNTPKYDKDSVPFLNKLPVPGSSKQANVTDV